MTATLRPLDDVEHIRRLLSPERVARRPIPAPTRPSFVVDLDDRPVRVYASRLSHTGEHVDDAIRLARRTGRVVRHDDQGAPIVDHEAELRGMPTAGQCRARTLAALDWLHRDGADLQIALRREAQLTRLGMVSRW